MKRKSLCALCQQKLCSFGRRLSCHVTFPVKKKRFRCCWVTNEGLRPIREMDGTTQTDHRGHTQQATLCPFLSNFFAWKWKKERNMRLHARIYLQVYCSHHFYEPAGCRGPKPQALPSPLLCSSCPKAIIRGACQTGPLLWHIDTEWLAHAHTYTLSYT